MSSRDGQDDARSSQGVGQRADEQDVRSESEELPATQQQVEDREDDEDRDDPRHNDDLEESDRTDGQAEVSLREEPVELEHGSPRDQSSAEAGASELSPNYAAPSVAEMGDDVHGGAEAQVPLPGDLGAGGESDHNRHGTDTSDADIESMNADQLRHLVSEMRLDHENQLQAEERARSEVEEMCLRIEKHFKAEKVTRAHTLVSTALSGWLF